MKLIKFTRYDSMDDTKVIYINPENVEFILENPEGKTDIGFTSKNVCKVKETISQVKGRLGIED